MPLEDIFQWKLEQLYQGKAFEILSQMGSVIAPKLDQIVDRFYIELMELPEAAALLENSITQKHLKRHLKNWIIELFTPHDHQQILKMVERQKSVGTVHANINVDVQHFMYGITILKREIYACTHHLLAAQVDPISDFLTLGQVFDILVTIIADTYVAHDILHETSELSLRINGLGQNTALECERLRGMLFDWLRNALPSLYQTPEIDPSIVPKLQYSNFGLWVLYKGDLISSDPSIKDTLNAHIIEIDHLLTCAIEEKNQQNQEKFFSQIIELNNAVTKASWFIASLVERSIELDTGMDPLTRLFNRRYLETILRRQTVICRREKLPYSIAMIDLDHFKSINDNHGHNNGDLVLKQFAEIILLSIRASDFAFRYGGEEFLILLGNSDEAKAIEVADRIRRKCESYTFKLSAETTLNLTCSVGIATNLGNPDYQPTIKAADEALYMAKAGGRNQIQVLMENME